jgi:hypothetical protein
MALVVRAEVAKEHLKLAGEAIGDIRDDLSREMWLHIPCSPAH